MYNRKNTRDQSGPNPSTRRNPVSRPSSTQSAKPARGGRFSGKPSSSRASSVLKIRLDPEAEKRMRKAREIRKEHEGTKFLSWADDEVEKVISGPKVHDTYADYDKEKREVAKIISDHFMPLRAVDPGWIEITRCRSDNENQILPLRLAHYNDKTFQGGKVSDLIPHVRGIIVDLEKKIVIISSVGKNEEVIVDTVEKMVQGDRVGANSLHYNSDYTGFTLTDSNQKSTSFLASLGKLEDDGTSKVFVKSSLPDFKFDITPDLEGITIRIFRYWVESRQETVTVYATYKNLFAFDSFKVSEYNLESKSLTEVRKPITLKQMYEDANGPSEGDLFYLGMHSYSESEGDKDVLFRGDDWAFCYHVLLMSPQYSRCSIRPIGDKGRCVLLDITKVGKETGDYLPRLFARSGADKKEEIFSDRANSSNAEEQYSTQGQFYHYPSYWNDNQQYINPYIYPYGYSTYSEQYMTPQYPSYQTSKQSREDSEEVVPFEDKTEGPTDQENDKYSGYPRYSVDQVYGKKENVVPKFRKLTILPGIENKFVGCFTGDTSEKRLARYKKMIEDSISSLIYPMGGERVSMDDDQKTYGEKMVDSIPKLQSCDQILIRQRDGSGNIIKITTVRSPSYEWKSKNRQGDDPRSITDSLHLFLDNYELIIKGKYDSIQSVASLGRPLTDGFHGGIFSISGVGRVHLDSEKVGEIMKKNKNIQKKLVQEYEDIGDEKDVMSGSGFLLPEDVITGVDEKFFATEEKEQAQYANSFVCTLVSLSPHYQKKAIDGDLYSIVQNSISNVADFVLGLVEGKDDKKLGGWKNPVKAPSYREGRKKCLDILGANAGDDEDKDKKKILGYGIIQMTPIMKELITTISSRKDINRTGAKGIVRSLIAKEKDKVLYRLWIASRYYEINPSVIFFEVSQARRTTGYNTDETKRSTYKRPMKPVYRRKK